MSEWTNRDEWGSKPQGDSFHARWRSKRSRDRDLRYWSDRVLFTRGEGYWMVSQPPSGFRGSNEPAVDYPYDV